MFKKSQLEQPMLSAPLLASHVSKWDRVLMGTLAVFAFVLLAITANEDWRQTVHAHFNPPFRTILSKASGKFLNAGMWLDVLKVQTDEGLFVEVYINGEKEQSHLVNRMKLSGSKDAYFHSQLQATRLVIEDMDGSGRPSIVVPSFDADLIAHVNVFRILDNGQTQQVADNR